MLPSKMFKRENPKEIKIEAKTNDILTIWVI